MNSKKEREVERILKTYRDTLYRTAYLLLGNPHDVEDVLQEVLLRYLEKAPVFASPEHEKAWLLRVTSNRCKDCLRFRKKTRYADLESLAESFPVSGQRDNFIELFALPAKWKTVLILYYFEGYQLKEIAQILKISESAAKKRLQRARDALKIELAK